MYFKDYSRNKISYLLYPTPWLSHTPMFSLLWWKNTNWKPNSILYSYLAWIWHAVRSAVKGNSWFILIPVGKNHRWVIWPLEQGWHIVILETHPNFLFNICNLKLGQHFCFNIIFKLTGKKCVISKIKCFIILCSSTVILFFLQWEETVCLLSCFLTYTHMTMSKLKREGTNRKKTQPQTNRNNEHTRKQKRKIPSTKFRVYAKT